MVANTTWNISQIPIGYLIYWGLLLFGIILNVFALLYRELSK